MYRTVGGLAAALAITLLLWGMGNVTSPGTVQAQTHSATRSLAAAWVAPGGEMRVTIFISNLGPFGQVVETLPEGFTLLRTDLEEDAWETQGQTVSFTLFDVTQFSYVVRAPMAPRTYTFSGVIVNSNRQERTISGHTQLRVGPPPTPTPTPTATPTPTPSPTPTPIPTATPTPTPQPTATATPTPTPMPSPTPVPTATPAPAATPSPVPTAASTPAPATGPAAEAGGIPRWVWVLPLALLALVLGVVWYVRRKS